MFGNIKNILVLAAHPDDEVLGCGGFIHKAKLESKNILVAIPGTGITSREQGKEKKEDQQSSIEQLKENIDSALSILGLSNKNYILGEFTDNQFDTHSLLELTKWLEHICQKFKPDLIITHHQHCTNIDHRYCFEAAVLATRPFEHQQIHLWTMEVPSSTGYLKPTQWEPNLYIQLSQENLEAKLKALEAYKGEIRSFPHPRSTEYLEALAKIRGGDSGNLAAEAFTIVRSFIG